MQVDSFLEPLLLLIHLTGGQPARGTEILSLRHMNTVNGHHRNVFVENEMVSTVTTCHKGYNVTGSTKIIHHYLPKEVGELLVYYLWIVRPGATKLQLFAHHRTGPSSPFIWAKENVWECWDSSRLSRILRREFQAYVGMTINIWPLQFLGSVLAVVASRETMDSRIQGSIGRPHIVRGRRAQYTLAVLKRELVTWRRGKQSIVRSAMNGINSSVFDHRRYRLGRGHCVV